MVIFLIKEIVYVIDLYWCVIGQGGNIYSIVCKVRVVSDVRLGNQKGKNIVEGCIDKFWVFFRSKNIFKGQFIGSDKDVKFYYISVLRSSVFIKNSREVIEVGIIRCIVICVWVFVIVFGIRANGIVMVIGS